MNPNSVRSGRLSLGLAAVIALTVCAGAHAAKPVKPPPPPPTPTHQFIRLGTLGGTFANAAAVNQSGLVAGYVDLAGEPRQQHAFLIVPADVNEDDKLEWFSASAAGSDRNTLMLDLGVGTGFEEKSSYATDLNDVGQVLVNCYDNANAIGPLAFIVNPADVDSDGQLEWFSPDLDGANALMQPLSPGPGVTVTTMYALGINRHGQVVGLCNGRGFLVNGIDTGSDGVADTWDQDLDLDGNNDLYLDLGAAVGLRGYLLPLQPTRINNAGQIVGRVPMDPVNTDLGDPFIITPKSDGSGNCIWNEDKNSDGINDLVVKLPLLATGVWGNALGVNSAGVIVGWSQTKGSNPHAMMWRVDAQGLVTTTDLGILQGEAQSMAAAVNNNLQVAGFARTYYMRKMSIAESAFLWENGAMKDLRDFVDQGALLEGRRVGASGINNQGMIVGWAWDDVSAYPYIALPTR